MYDGKLVQAKHYFEMSTILLYYDSSQIVGLRMISESSNGGGDGQKGEVMLY